MKSVLSIVSEVPGRCAAHGGVWPCRLPYLRHEDGFVLVGELQSTQVRPPSLAIGFVVFVHNFAAETWGHGDMIC